MLDEPTNDLDLETLDLLQEVIADYDGTVLIVSHDRDFLDRTVTVTLGLDGSGKVDIVAGGYEDWAKRRSPVPLAGGAGSARAPRPRQRSTPWPPPARGRGKKLSYKDQRDLDLLPARDRAARSGDRRRRGRAPRSRPLRPRPRALRRADRSASPRHRAEKDAAEQRWLEVAEMAEALATNG